MFLLIDVLLQPAAAPRARNKMDSLLFLPDTVKAASGSGARQVSDLQEPEKEPEVEVEVENVERPVDLYKVKRVCLRKFML